MECGRDGRDPSGMRGRLVTQGARERGIERVRHLRDQRAIESAHATSTITSYSACVHAVIPKPRVT